MTDRPATRGLRLDAPAKINLYLRFLSRRTDGYHSIDSVFAFAEVGDELTAAPAEKIALRIDGPNAGALQGEASNLVLRAARALAQSSSIQGGADLTLTKNLPVAAGIGGGSADAAATLRLLSQLWRLDIDHADLARIALSLGADVPGCLRGDTVRATGIGEKLEPVSSLPPLEIVLVNNGRPLETAAVFRVLDGVFTEPAPSRLPFEDAASTARLCASLGNDLLGPACKIEPSIANVLGALEAEDGCLLAQLSGSGPTCFAIFDSAESSLSAAARLSQDNPDWWVRASRFRDGPAAIEPMD